MGVIALVLLACAAMGAGQIGDPAGPLEVDEWIKGGPVDLADGKGEKIYVVEFWATWCPPCRTSIPHLTKLQKTYRDKNVVVVGISSSDRDLNSVKSFVENQGDAMDYVVAYEDRSDAATSQAYMGGYGQNGIPTAFIVDKKGQVVWVGHPMAMDTPLKEVVEGTFDVEAFRTEFGKQAEREKARREVEGLAQEYFALAAGDGDDPKMKEIGTRIYEKMSEDPVFLNAFSWEILTGDSLKHRDPDLALKAAKQANQLTQGKDASIVDTYARALWDTGDRESAVREQRKAVELASDNPRMKADLEETLRRYESDSSE
jgi:thiol-disulfide isomerase/thioredoxin